MHLCVVPALLLAMTTVTLAQTVDEEPAPDAATSAPTRIDHPDAIRFSNGTIDLAVSPQVGRIVHFGQTGGRNLLWANTVKAVEQARKQGQWVNYGGDKVWPALQAMWPRFVPSGGGWPPDGVIDGEPWTLVEQGDRFVIMRSPINPDLQVRVTRRIELHPGEAIVTIRNTMERVEPSVMPVLIWTVSQIDHPNYTLLHVSPRRPANELDRPWLWFGNRKNVEDRVTVMRDAVRFDVTREKAYKVGTLGDWVAGVYDDLVFAQYGGYVRGGSYPDRSCAQVYCDGNYVELELLGPQQHLARGETMDFVVTWKLLPLPAGSAADAAAAAALVEASR